MAEINITEFKSANIEDQNSSDEFELDEVEDLRVVVGVGEHVKSTQKIFYRNFLF